MICLISACCFRYKALWRHTLHHIYLVLLSFSFHPCCSVTQSCPALCNCGLQHNGFLILHHLLSLLKLMSIELVMTYNHLILCHPLLLPSIFPSIRVCLISHVFTSCGQSIGASASAAVLPMNIQGWFSLGLTGLIFLQTKGLSRVFSKITVQKQQFFSSQPSLWSNSHIHTWLLEKNIWLCGSLLAK